jgi:hypothetical protein
LEITVFGFFLRFCLLLESLIEDVPKAFFPASFFFHPGRAPPPERPSLDQFLFAFCLQCNPVLNTTRTDFNFISIAYGEKVLALLASAFLEATSLSQGEIIQVALLWFMIVVEARNLQPRGTLHAEVGESTYSWICSSLLIPAIESLLSGPTQILPEASGSGLDREPGVVDAISNPNEGRGRAGSHPRHGARRVARTV